jgi:hypothetical protein
LTTCVYYQSDSNPTNPNSKEIFKTKKGDGKGEKKLSFEVWKACGNSRPEKLRKQ